MATARDFAASLRALNDAQLDIIAQNLVDSHKGVLARKDEIFMKMTMVCQRFTFPRIVESC